MLKDNGHICACLQLRNKGIVFEHFFWFREDKQDDPNLEKEIKELPFTTSRTHGTDTTGVIPDGDYLVDHFGILPSAEVAPLSSGPLTSEMEPYALLQSAFKGINQDTIKSEDTYMNVKRMLVDLAAHLSTVASGNNTITEDKRILIKSPQFLSKPRTTSLWTVRATPSARKGGTTTMKPPTAMMKTLMVAMKIPMIPIKSNFPF